MKTIFEKLDIILKSITEAAEPEPEEKPTPKLKPIPIRPEMETEEQGLQMAWEKLSKYFYNLGMEGNDGPPSTSDDVELPDDFLSPELKGKIEGKLEDKEFKKNKVDWDNDGEYDKLKKEVNMDVSGADEDDEFDDFDYQDNEFGDDADTSELDTEDMEGGGGGSDSMDDTRSEDEKLRDELNDAIDKMKDDKGGSKSEKGEKSGKKSEGKSGSEEGGDTSEEGGDDSGGSSGAEGREKTGKKSGGESGGEPGEDGQMSGDGGEPGDDEDDEDGSGSGSGSGRDSGEKTGGESGGEGGEGGEYGDTDDSSGVEGGAGGESGGSPKEGGHDATSKPGSSPETAKDKRLEELKRALEEGDEEAFDRTAEDMKDGDDGTGKLAGEHRGEVDDEAVRKDMETSGLSKEDIDEIIKKKNEDTSKGMSEEEMEKLKKDVVDGLEKKCEKRGGSALAKTVVKRALKSKIDNMEWKEMLKLFLKSKSKMKGSTSKAKTKTVYGHKNHLWRDSVLPTKTYGHGEIQKIYCFIDFSGSVNQDLVYTFLGRVIDLCQELSYTDVVVYGFGDRIVLPRKINGKMLKIEGKDVVLSKTWDYINSQHPGWGSENFEDVAHTINDIRRKDKDSVFLIFGDALWSAYGNPHPPMYVKSVCGNKVLDDICVLTYYMHENSEYAGEIAYLKELVGFKSVITTKASSIRD